VENTKNKQVNAVQAFLISSITGSMCAIVALVLFKQSIASTATDMIRRVVNAVQACGFIVVTVASVNNLISEKAFEQLCGSDDVI
jgi:TctA family transporter